MSATLTATPRLRRSPFHAATVAEGAAAFMVYNRMLMASGYGDPLGEYRRLMEGVAMWDVAAQRQVEVAGPDAAHLVQMLTPRKLARLQPGVGWYVPLCDHRGTLVNDPILLKLAEDRFWFSIADSDVALFARAVAGAHGLDVRVSEPDVSPLAVQGPKAVDTLARLLGDWVRQIGHFRFRAMDLDGIPLLVARSGWSKQGGFELYLMDGARGDDLWQRVRAAGAPDGIGPGAPNQMERVESGLLSYGGDTDDSTNPFEVRMERYVDLDAPDAVLSIAALRRIQSQGPRRHQLGVVMDLVGDLTRIDRWSPIYPAGGGSGDPLGHVTAHAWSPRLQRNIGLALVARSLEPGAAVHIELPDGRSCSGEMCRLPFF